jgi:hypothetical protein
MEINNDFKELLACFNDHNVEFTIVGGYAVAFHGAPRWTQDLDVCYRRTAQNAKSIVSALTAFGFGSLNIAEQDLLTENLVIQLGHAPSRIDLINTLSGVDADDVWKTRIPGAYGDISVHFISKPLLIKNKQATGRHKDLGDLDKLPNKVTEEKK